MIGNIGMATMAEATTKSVIYDSNPQFSHINLYAPGNSLSPVISRDGGTTIEDRVG